MPSSIVIQIENLTKRFGKEIAVNDVSMNIEQGDVICLLGPSGAGKSTLIRLIIGAISANYGQISFGSIVVPNLSLLGKIGYMPQNDALYDDLSGEDNLQFFAALYKLSKKDLASQIEKVLAITDLTEHRHKIVRNYSGGMKKRLSLATALLSDPEILLLDEPTVGIDPMLRRIIWDQFHQMKDNGKTILITTHVMDEVTECDKAALLYDGQLIHYDTVTNLISSTQTGRIEELFLKAAEKKEAYA